MEFTISSMQLGYERVVAYVRENGRQRSPRGLLTYEVPGAQIVLTDPSKSLPVGIGRAVSTRIAAIEALQLVGGFCDPAAMLRASPAMAIYMEGGNFHGGYGVRTRGQVPIVIDRLIGDPDTRQAQMTLWDPSYDLLVTDAKDFPCTTSIQFFIVDGALECHVHMRSNDVWRGFSIDVFVFCQLQLAVAAVLGLPAGKYFHHAASLHMYKTDVNASMKLHLLASDAAEFSLGSLFTRGTWLDWRHLARYVRQDMTQAWRDASFRKPGVGINADVHEWYLMNLMSSGIDA